LNRRDLLILSGTAIAWPLVACAPEKAMPVIGFLSTGSLDTVGPLITGFYQGLREAGYVVGQNVAIEHRWAEGRYDRLPALAAELVGRKVEVIMTGVVPHRRWRRNTRPRRFRSPSSAPIRSGTGWSPVFPGPAATSRGSACSPSS